MTDHQSPDDLGADAFDGLGLESLTEGAHATSAQWSAIAADGARRRQRRSWTVAAAALVVLLVGSVAVLTTRSGDDGVDVATGAGLARDQYVLPPEGSRVIALFEDPTTWFVQYEDPEGQFWLLGSFRISGLDPGYTGTTPFGIIEQMPRFGLTQFTCSLGEPEGTQPPDGHGFALVQPLRASWGADYDGATLVTSQEVPFNAPQPWAEPEPCVLPTGPDPALAAQMDSLRIVSAEEWQQFVMDNDMSRVTSPTAPIDPSTSTTTSSSSTTTSTSTTTTPTKVDGPTDPRSAEEQISLAMGDWQRRDASGSFVYLEDGTEKAAEYAEMFALAARQSGADQDDGSVGDTVEVTSMEFVTPERARITVEFTSTLPTGRYTFGQDGEAILQDGRWVITYRTVTNTLGRACLPPGGYDGCP